MFLFNQNHMVNIVGILVTLSITLFGVNHRAAIYVVAVLSFIGIFYQVFLFQYPYQFKQKKTLLITFLSYPALVFLTLIIHGQWDIFSHEMDNPLRFVLMIPIFFLLVRLDINERYVAAGFILGAAAIGLNAGINFESDRVGLSYGNPIPMGDVAVVLSIIAFYTVIMGRGFDISWKFISLVAFVLGIIATILSGTKGAWLAFIILYVYLIFFQIKKSFHKMFAIVSSAFFLLRWIFSWKIFFPFICLTSLKIFLVF